MRRITLILTLIALLLLASSVLAMGSTNYELKWFTPLSSGGGGKVASANYVSNFTVGQSVIGTSSSINYEGCLGYWCATEIEYKVYLPLTLRSS